MGFDRRSQIDVGNDLSVDDHERLIVQKLASFIQGAGSAEYIRFFASVLNMYSELLTVAESANHRVRLMVKIYDDVSYSEAADIFGNIADKRLPEKWDGRLCPVYGEGKQPRAEPGSQDHRFHSQEYALAAL